MKIQMQERDELLLQNLHRYGVLSTRQIIKIIFQNIASSTGHRRLRSIEEAGYIKNCGHLPDGTKVWSISKLGSQKINKEPPIRYSNQNTHQHDVYLSEVRMCLESIGLGEDWTTDAELKRNLGSYKATSIIPDGLFIGHIFGKDHVIALELELNAKSHKRYQKIFYDYSYIDAVNILWYIVNSQSVIKPVLKMWHEAKNDRRHPPPQKIIFTELSDLLENKLESSVMTEIGEILKLSLLTQRLKAGDPQSSETNSEPGNLAVNNLKEDQSLTPAPDFKKSVSSALDHSPPT